MALTEHLAGSQTCTINTEHTLNTTTPDTTPGAYALVLDLNALAATAGVADVLEVRLKRKVQNSSGTMRVVWYDVFTGVQGDEKAWTSPFIPFLHGWDMTIKQTAGTGRAIPWSIAKA